MANEQKIYRRKISDSEAQGQYILILKNDLDFFPKVGKPFKLSVKGKDDKKAQVFETTVSAVECWCMGPKKPHDHYRIDAKPFRSIYPVQFSKKIEITRKADDEFSLS